MKSSVVTSDDRVKTRSRFKRTKRWCGGKEGREHDSYWTTNEELQANTPQNVELMRKQQAWREQEKALGNRTFDPMGILICRVCGKHLKYR